MHIPQISDDGSRYMSTKGNIDTGSTKLQYQTFEHVPPYYHDQQERYVVDYCDRTGHASVKVRYS